MRGPVDRAQLELTFLQFDFCPQALAKIERVHAQDLTDVEEMFGRGLINRVELLLRFEQIEKDLYRCPALHPLGFRRAVEAVVAMP